MLDAPEHAPARHPHFGFIGGRLSPVRPCDEAAIQSKPQTDAEAETASRIAYHIDIDWGCPKHSIRFFRWRGSGFLRTASAFRAWSCCARNARTHSDAQVAQIAASIKEFGFVNPIVAGTDRVIIAGDGRLLAARKLGMMEVPVIVLDGLNENLRRALVLADNKLALNKDTMISLFGFGRVTEIPENAVRERGSSSSSDTHNHARGKPSSSPPGGKFQNAENYGMVRLHYLQTRRAPKGPILTK